MAEGPATEKGQSVAELGAASNLFDGSVPFPAAVLRTSAVDHNIGLMRRYCADHGVALAPHGKTTMSEQVIRRQLDAGAWAVTVATAWQLSVVAGMRVDRIILANELVDSGSIRIVEQVLRQYPKLEMYCYVDSVAGLDLLAGRLAPEVRERVAVLVEIGLTNGRTGVRDDQAAAELARRVTGSPLRLSGVAAFEGIIGDAVLDTALAGVDALLARLERLCLLALDEGLLEHPEPILTVGGSAYFDRVVQRLPAVVTPRGVRVVLRSGCYVTHDCGTYDRLSPLGGRAGGATRLEPAIEVWAAVLSRPEPTRLVAGLGRRDVSADAGLPVPLWLRTSAGLHAATLAWSPAAINDQHLMLDVPVDAPVEVGDLIGFGISHPCTTFDKWRQLSFVDDDYNLTGTAGTHF